MYTRYIDLHPKQCGTIETWAHLLLAPRDCVKHKYPYHRSRLLGLGFKIKGFKGSARYFLLWSPLANIVCGMLILTATAIIFVANPFLEHILLSAMGFTFLLDTDFQLLRGV